MPIPKKTYDKNKERQKWHHVHENVHCLTVESLVIMFIDGVLY